MAPRRARSARISAGMTRPPSTTPGLGVRLCAGAVLGWGMARDAVRHSPHHQAMRGHATVVLVPESGCSAVVCRIVNHSSRL